MFHKTATRVVATFLCAVMILCSVPMTAFASIPNWETENEAFNGTSFGTNGYYTVISKKDYVLVPGAATETEMVINNADGTRRQVLHIIEVDPSNPDVSLVPGYYNIDKDITDVANQQAAKLTDMAKYYEEKLGYNIVGGMNTDLYYAANAPRVLVYNGQDMRDYGATSSVLCVYEAADGTISVDVKAYSKATMDDELANGHATRGKLLHAVGVSFGMTVMDGELVSKTEERTSSAAARSMVGVKPDGTLVICMNDGRGANNSVGFCNYELGESMLALGCQWAANCDGGGSSTFISKRVGEEEFTMRSTPCDGAERPTIHGIFVTSNVGPTGELDYAEIEAGYDYYAPGTSYKFGAKGIDTNGYQMEIPAEATWALSDTSFGTIAADGTFASNGKVGDVDIQMVSGGAVIGSKTIHVANPATLNLSATSTVLPYSTADKVRTITLPIVAQVGEAKVYYDTNVFEISLSDESAGTLGGFNFTATTDESVVGVVITAKYLPTNTVLTYNVEFGKGSEVVWNFENGDVSNFMSFDEVRQWSKENGVNNTTILAGDSAPIGGQFSPEADGSTFLSSVTNGGQVKNGQYALGWNADNTNVSFAGWTYNILFNVGMPVVLRDVANGQKATAFGMWAYIPEGATGIAMQLQVYAGTSKETAKGTSMHFNFISASTGKATTLNAATEADIPESRWVYMTASLAGNNYVSLVDPYKNTWGREPSFIRTYVKPTEPAVHTFYFDDFTLDYSSAVDDRFAPTFSGFTYDPYADTSVELKDGAQITQTSIYGVRGFAAMVSDASAIDELSRKITIDGVPVHTSYANGRIYCTEHFLLPGTHTITFEIADEMGNVGTASKTFTIVDSDAFITLSGHNDLGNAPEAGSIYYIDLNVSDLSKVGDKLVTTLKLQNANTWETEGAVVADGFQTMFDYNEISGLLDVVVEKTGDVAAEAGTLVSIPVRVWSWNGYHHSNEAVITPEAQFASGYCPIVSIKCEIVYGNMEGKGYHEAVMGAFGGSFSVATNLNDNINPWHYHDKELTVLNKEATATQNGYENRTYCETCGSVIDWGTVVEAKGHNYVLIDGKFVCSDEGCGDVYEVGTGLFEMNGANYYAIAGKLVTGWQDIDGEQYFFDKVTYEGLNGLHSSYEVCSTSQSFQMSFTNGKLDSGVWVKMEGGTRYYYGKTYYHNTTVEIDGNTYSFRNNGYRYEGTCVIRWNPQSQPQLFEFTADGVYVGELYENGVYTTSDGSVYYLTEGIASTPGLIKQDDAYYYFAAGRLEAVTNGLYNVTVTNGLLNAGFYSFGADGKMLIKQGLVKDDDGEIRYYVDGEAKYAGLVKDADGAYYYISGNGLKAVKDCTRYITFTNGLLPEGTYKFGADGKMLIKQGVVKDDDGEIRYYVDGVAQYAGLVRDTDGSYYYISGNGGKAVKDCTRYITFTNGLLPEGTYKFGADGKMLIKQGVVKDDDGEIRYYVDGVAQYAGLVRDTDGSYYYISGNGGKAVKDCTRYITFTNGLLPEGTYKFGADGKMLIKQGVVKDGDGEIRYYVDGVAQYAGLVRDTDGSYYYISGNGGKAVKDCTRYITFTNGLLPEGLYTFGEDGKMIIE